MSEPSTNQVLEQIAANFGGVAPVVARKQIDILEEIASNTSGGIGGGGTSYDDTAIKSRVSSLETALPTKVDAVAGKQLSSEDFTSDEKVKLAGLEGSMYRGTFTTLALLTAGVSNPAPGNYADVDNATAEAGRYIWSAGWVLSETSASALTGAQVKTLYESNPDTNSYSNADKAKVASVATNATANNTDAFLLDRANQTGEQAVSTVTGLQTALDNKVAIVAGKGLSTSDFTAAEKTKLAGIATGATANNTDTFLRARSNHTGEQEISTVTGLQTALDTKVAAVAGKGLSTNDYTTVDKNKLTDLDTRVAATEQNKVDKVAGKSLSTEDFTSAEKTKLAGLGSGSSYTDAQAAIAGLGALKRVDLSLYGDATTNAASALQTIINAGNIAYIPPGKTVLVNDAVLTLNSSVPRCHIVNDGRLVCSKANRLFTLDQPFATPVTVTAISDVTYNTEAMTRITLSSVAGLGIGSIIKVYCDARYPWVDPNGDSPFMAETVKISAVDVANNYAYVPSMVWGAEMIAAATVRAAQQLEYEFSLTGLGSIGGDGDPDAAPYNTAVECMRIQGVVDPLILHRVKDAWGLAIRLESTYQGRIILDLSGQKNDVTGTPKIYGYGVHYGRGCTGGIIDVQARDGRHPFTSDFDDTGVAFNTLSIKDYGGPMYPKVTGSAIGTRGTAFDTHAFLGFATFYNCKVSGVRISPSGSGTSGINNRGYGTHIIDADVRNCGVGINDDSYGQNTGKKISTLIQGGSLIGNPYGIKAGGVQMINSVLSPELNQRLTIRDMKITDATQGIQLDVMGGRVVMLNNQYERMTDVSVGVLSDALIHEKGRIEDRSQFGAAKDGASGNGMYKVTAAVTSVTAIQLFDSLVFGSTSRPTAYITGSGTAPAMGPLRVGGNRFPDRSTGLVATAAATVSSYVDDDCPPAFRTTSTSYTFTLLDAKRPVEFNSTSATTATVPLNLDLPIGAVIVGIRNNTGAVSIAGAAGVTINKASATAGVAAQFGEFTLTKTDANVYRLSGALS